MPDFQVAYHKQYGDEESADPGTGITDHHRNSPVPAVY